jgi:hypothetical protein
VNAYAACGGGELQASVHDDAPGPDVRAILVQKSSASA